MSATSTTTHYIHLLVEVIVSALTGVRCLNALPIYGLLAAMVQQFYAT